MAKGWKYDDVFGGCCFLSGVGRGYEEDTFPSEKRISWEVEVGQEVPKKTYEVCVNDMC